MQVTKAQTGTFFILLFFTTFLLHFKIFTLDVIGYHVWRQTQTQTITDNFYEENMNILDPRINCREDGTGVYRTDFPLLQWCIAATYFVFGEHILVTRIFIFILGLITVYLFYRSLMLVFGRTIYSLAGTWAFAFSPLLYYYTLNPLPDNICIFFLCWFLYLFVSYKNTNKKKYLLFSYFALSIATLVKLPFGIYFVIPALYVIMQQQGNIFRKFIRSLPDLLYMLAILLPVITWYFWVIPQMEGNPVLTGVFNDSSKSKYFSYLAYYILEILPGILLNYILLPVFIAGLYFIYRYKGYKTIAARCFIVCAILLCLYILFEANALGYAHDYYFFPFLPILFIITTYGIKNLYALRKKPVTIILTIAITALPLMAYLRMQGRWSENRPGFNKNIYDFKADLKNAVPSDALVVTGNDESRYIWMYHLDKKGWNFKNDAITPLQLNSMIAGGAEYLYSDSKKIEDPLFASLLDTLIMQRGDVKVYKLRGE